MLLRQNKGSACRSLASPSCLRSALRPRAGVRPSMRRQMPRRAVSQLFADVPSLLLLWQSVAHAALRRASFIVRSSLRPQGFAAMVSRRLCSFRSVRHSSPAACLFAAVRPPLWRSLPQWALCALHCPCGGALRMRCRAAAHALRGSTVALRSPVRQDARVRAPPVSAGLSYRTMPAVPQCRASLVRVRQIFLPGPAVRRSNTSLWRHLRTEAALRPRVQRIVSCWRLSTLHNRCFRPLPLRPHCADGKMRRAGCWREAQVLVSVRGDAKLRAPRLQAALLRGQQQWSESRRRFWRRWSVCSSTCS